MDTVGVFYSKIFHTKREYSWEHFVAPNARVEAEWIISMRFQ